MNVLYIDYGNVVDDNHMYQYYGDLFRELKALARVWKTILIVLYMV